MRSGADEQRTDVESCAAFIRRDEALVQADGFFDHGFKQIGGQFGHHDTSAGALQACGIFFHAEDAHFSVGATKGFKPLEGFLSIVQTSGRHVYVDAFRGTCFYFSPLAVAPIAANVVVGGYVAEGKVFPIDVFHCVYVLMCY